MPRIEFLLLKAGVKSANLQFDLLAKSFSQAKGQKHLIVWGSQMWKIAPVIILNKISLEFLSFSEEKQTFKNICDGHFFNSFYHVLWTKHLFIEKIISRFISNITIISPGGMLRLKPRNKHTTFTTLKNPLGIRVHTLKSSKQLRHFRLDFQKKACWQTYKEIWYIWEQLVRLRIKKRYNGT